MISFLKRCWQRRWIRGFTWTFVSLVTLLVLFTAWVNWLGARVWNEAQQRVLAEKLTLDFRQTLPDPVPDAENFCATPLLKDIAVVVDSNADKGEPAAKRKALAALGLPVEMTSPSGVRRPAMQPKPGQSPQQLMSEWAAWLREMKVSMPVTDAQNPAREVLAALSYQDAGVAELAARLDLPLAQLTPATKSQVLPEMLFEMQIPHFGSLQSAVTGLAVRAIAAAHAGDAAKAHEAARIMARLTQAIGGEPFLIGLLVSRSAASTTATIVSTLCQTRVGSAEDFLKLRRDLERLDFQEAASRAWRGELAAGVDAVMYFKRSRDPEFLSMVQGLSDGNGKIGGGPFPLFLPSGLFDMNAANMVHMEIDYIIRPLRDGGWKGVLQAQTEMEQHFKEAKVNWPTNLDKIFPAIIMPSASLATSTTLYGECLVNQAIIACALEQYFAEHQSYPDTLEPISRAGGPALPLDPADGAPMRYRKTADGRYQLWSVGFDLVDDGGKRGEKAGEKSKPSKLAYKGDWVWDYSGK
jgi:hypothetical protein